MKKILLFALLFLSACATPYRQAARSDYVGNGQYEIRSNGNEMTPEDDVRRFLYRKAFAVCAAENKGFRILRQDDVSRTVVSSYSRVGNEVVPNEALHPGARMLISCEGPIDERMAAQVKAYKARDK